MRLRPYRKMVEDPSFHLQVGRLVGASEMAAALLLVGKLSAQELADVGARLQSVTNWFLVRDDDDSSPTNPRAG
jgi:hypothetical protein